MGCLVWIVVAVFTYAYWDDIRSAIGWQTYIAEVGYYAGDMQRWELGPERQSLDACRADVRFMVIAKTQGTNPTRVFSTACRIMHGEKFMDRTR